MTRKIAIPPIRLHKHTGQGYVILNGRRHYLGKYTSSEAAERHQRLIAEWQANGHRAPVRADDFTVVELSAAFLQHAATFYRRPDGTSTSTIHNYKAAIRFLKELYGNVPVADFGVMALRAVRESMIQADWSRGVVNQGVNLVRAIFRWAVSEGLVPEHVHRELTSLASLSRGRSKARETEPRKPVSEADIEAVRDHVPSPVWGLIRLQLSTGARAGELVGLRPIDIDTTRDVWTIQLVQHKTSHHGHPRVIYVGPKGQAALRPFLANRPVDKALFSPREAEDERHAAAPAHRRPDQKPNPTRTDRTLGDCYTVASYRRCIERACVEAGIPVWTPHGLRHSAATRLRAEAGLDVCQTVLGHRVGSLVTELYAEASVGKAIDVVRKIG